MRSIVTPGFRTLYNGLPERVQQQATEAYKLFALQPDHPSLRFKKITDSDALYSARIGRRYRVLGVLEDDVMTWFWIGSHVVYERLLKDLV